MTDEESLSREELLLTLELLNSERCAGWLYDCEFYIWNQLTGLGPHSSAWDDLSVDGQDLDDRLRLLAVLAGGWFRWVSTETDVGPRFIPREEWDALVVGKTPKPRVVR